jgi:hypothetical protein
LQATIDQLPGYATSKFWQEHKQQQLLGTFSLDKRNTTVKGSPASTTSPFLKTARTSKKSPDQTAGSSKPSLEMTLGKFKEKYSVNTGK